METKTPTATEQERTAVLRSDDLFEKLSPTQQAVIRWLHPYDTEQQIAGYGRAKYLSAARALVRKGYARSHRTGCYKLTDEGRAILPTE